MKIFQQSTIVGVVVLFAILLFSSSIVFSQNNCNYEPPRQAENWVFGNSAIINFSQGQANASLTPNGVLFPNGVSSISNKKGELKLFSDGLVVKNNVFFTVNNGSDLMGNNFASQSSIFVPKPGSNTTFYLFTVDMYIPPVFTDGVKYSIVEVPYSGGTSVTLKNQSLLNENAQKITATQHANGRDFWIVAHGFGDSKGTTFYSYLLSDTLQTTPVTTSIGHSHNGNQNSNNGAGSMKISPDGSRLALVIPDDGIVEVYNFDNETGKVGNLKASAAAQFVSANGIEFSPDNSKLYFSITPFGDGLNYIYQLDLDDSNPFSNPFEVHSFNVGETADSLLGALQLAPDGKIYVAKFRKGVTEKDNLGVIYNPNRKGEACNYNNLNHSDNNGLYLNGGKSLIGLPNFVSTFLDIPHFYFIDQCHRDTTKFTIRNNANIDDTDWDFNDSSGELADGDILAPGFVFSEPGEYGINLTEYYNSIPYNYSTELRIHPLPNVVLAEGVDTLYIIENSSVQLDAGNWDFYEWQPGGSTERYLDVGAEGLYSVQVTDSNCCRNADSVLVLYAKINFPNAFNPKSTNILNREFKVVGIFGGFKSYKMNIFNRWGQMVFESEDPTEGWDGTYNGEDAPIGTYVYSAFFESYESSVQSSIEVKKNGTVTLLR